MKTIDEVKDEVAQEVGFENWNRIANDYHHHYLDQVIKKYSEAAVRQDRENLKKNCIVNCEGSSMVLCFDSQPLPDLK